MKLLLFILLATTLTCQMKTTTNLGPERTEPAFIYANNLAVDGCEEFVRLDKGDSSSVDVMYKPTAASLPILQKALTSIPINVSSSERTVTIRFAETGQQVELQCGWASRPKVAEIEILSIAKR
jgi:hypothetical protein